MTIYIRGSVPKIDDESEILIDDYMEDFIQLGPESLFAFSSRLLTVDKNAIPYRYMKKIGIEYIYIRTHVFGKINFEMIISLNDLFLK